MFVDQVKFYSPFPYLIILTNLKVNTKSYNCNLLYILCKATKNYKDFGTIEIEIILQQYCIIVTLEQWNFGYKSKQSSQGPRSTCEATIQGHYGLSDLQNSKQKVQRVFHYLEGLNQRYYLQQTLWSFFSHSKHSWDKPAAKSFTPPSPIQTRA